MNIKKTRIYIGTWSLGGDYWGEQPHSNSLKMIHSALREGFYKFDTAPVYGKGRSEQLLGQQLKNEGQAKITTKCFTKPLPQFQKSFETSLKRLNRECIDSFLIHWPSSKESFEPLLTYLEEERKRGRVKKIGVSNFNLKQLKRAENYADIDIIQNCLNLFYRKELNIFNYAKERGIETQCYSPLAQGLLTGKFNLNSPYKKDDMRFKMTLFSEKNLNILYPCIERLSGLKNDLSLTNLSLLWCLNHADSVVVGCRNRKQVESLKELLNAELKNETYNELEKISQEVANKIEVGVNIFNHFY